MTTYEDYQRIVDRYLHSADRPDAALAAAVTAFTEPIDTAFRQTVDGGSTVGGLLWTAWHAVIRAADTPDEAAQARLVDLVLAVRDRGVLTRGDPPEECITWAGRVYADLPVFGAQLRSEWNENDETAARWRHTNAFAAQLTAAGFDFTMYALWTLSESLEDSATGLIELPIQAILAGSIPWLKYCGPALVSRCAHNVSYADPLDDPARAAMSTWTVDRWRSWRHRLQTLAAQGNETSATAREVLAYMSTWDREMVGIQ